MSRQCVSVLQVVEDGQTMGLELTSQGAGRTGTCPLSASRPRGQQHRAGRQQGRHHWWRQQPAALGAPGRLDCSPCSCDWAAQDQQQG